MARCLALQKLPSQIKKVCKSIFLTVYIMDMYYRAQSNVHYCSAGSTPGQWVKFQACWSSFLNNSVQHSIDSPIFHQFITEYLFKHTLKANFEVKEEEKCHMLSNMSLDYDEKNCIRYLFRAVQKKIKRSALHMKEELLLCMTELLEVDGGVYDESSDWISLVDRGGLNKHFG